MPKASKQEANQGANQEVKQEVGQKDNKQAATQRVKQEAKQEAKREFNWRRLLLGIVVVLLVLSPTGALTYLYLQEKENTRKYTLNASFKATFGDGVTMLGYEELTRIPIAVFKTKVADGREYTVLAGEFGSSWVILNKWETTAPVPTPIP